MTRTGQKTAFAFAGGGSLGAIASAGAINAAYFARGNLVWPATQRGLSGHLQKCIRSAQASGECHRFRRPAAYDRDQLGFTRAWRTRRFPIHVIATDVEGMSVVISKGPAIDAILASTAIPGVFPPVRIDGQTLIDGAIARDTPIRVAADLGASRIVVLPTGYAWPWTSLQKGR